jgi:hypothetical protein
MCLLLALPAPGSIAQVKDDELSRLLKDIENSDRDVRLKAWERLHNRFELTEPTKAQTEVLLRAASRRYADDTDAQSPYESADLIYLASLAKNKAHLGELVEELFMRFTDRGRSYALALLTEIDSDAEAARFIKLLDIAVLRDSIDTLRTWGWDADSRHGAVIFPAILKHVRNEKVGWDAMILLLDYLQEDALGLESRKACVKPIVDFYDEVKIDVVKHQRATVGRWLHDDDYAWPRSRAGLLLDLMGYLPGDDVGARLTDASESYSDPRLRFFAAMSILRRGGTVEPSTLESIASHAEVRFRMWSMLERMDKLALYPQKYRNRAALAESALCIWLWRSSETPHEPDAIELMETIEEKSVDGEVLYFLFRFRFEHDSWKDDGWLAGAVGPVNKDGELPTEYAAYSLFEKWSSKSSKEHLKELRSGLDDQ